MDFVAESVKQLPVGIAIWRIIDQTFVYANDLALQAFGATLDHIEKISLWDVIGPIDSSVILAESVRSNPHGGPAIHLPAAAFVTFKRIDNGSLFNAFYQAADIIEADGSTNYRVAMLFTDYDECTMDEKWRTFIRLKEEQAERKLAATVAHDLNNALAVLHNRMEQFSVSHGLDLTEDLKEPLEVLKSIGLNIFQVAEFPESISSINTAEELAELSRPTKTSPDPSDASSKFRLLVVDDDLALLAGLESVMKVRGIRIISASNTKEAMYKAEAFQPSAALIDLVLGDEDGYDLGQKLTALLPEINLIYMTGFANLSAHLATKNQQKILKKPFDISVAISLLKGGKDS